MGTFEEALNDVIDDDIEDLFGDSSKTIAKMVQQGIKKANKEFEACTIDISNDPVFYFELLDGRIQKIDKTDRSNITILYAQSGGTWANRATTNVYTKGGV